VLTIVAIDKLQNSSSAHLTIVHRREGGGRRGRRHH
jgi:hypothetical protein